MSLGRQRLDTGFGCPFIQAADSLAPWTPNRRMLGVGLSLSAGKAPTEDESRLAAWTERKDRNEFTTVVLNIEFSFYSGGYIERIIYRFNST